MNRNTAHIFESSDNCCSAFSKGGGRRSLSGAAILLLCLLLAPLAVAQEADLALQKFAVGTPRAGMPFHYEYQITNDGPDISRNVTLRDFLPSEVEFVNAFLDPDGDGPMNQEPVGVTLGSNGLFCSLGDIAVTVDGPPVILFVNVRIPADVPDGTVLVNSADVNLGETDDPDTSNNTASATITVVTRADISIGAAALPDPVTAGDILTCNLGVANLGPSDAQGVVIYDVLPDEVQALLGKSAVDCTQPPNLYGFRAILSGGNEVPPVSSSTDPSGTATFVLNTTTNELLFTIDVSDIASGITEANIHTGAAGANGPAEVTLYSGAPDFSSSKSLVDSVTITPVQAELFLASPAGFYVNVCTGDFPAGEIRGQLARTTNSPVRCEVGTVAANAEIDVAVPALVAADTPEFATIDNVAIVTTETSELGQTQFNNAASSKTLVDTLADVQVTQVSAKSATDVQAGEVFTFSIFVDNRGPSFASGVVLGAVLESTGTFDLIDVTSDRAMDATLSPGGGPFAVAASALPPSPPPPPFGVVAPTGVADIDRRLDFRCELVGSDDPLSPGALGLVGSGAAPTSGRWSLVVRARARNAQTINSVVTVSSDTADSETGNNQALDMVSVFDTADLQITKTATAGPVAPGDTITYSITVENLGPSPSSGVMIRDVLPAEVEVVSVSGLAASGDPVSCAGGTPGDPLDPATCFLGSMLAGETGSMTVGVRVRGDIALDSVTHDRIIHNAAHVLSDTFDPENGNNLAGTFTTVECAAPDAPTDLDASDGTACHTVFLQWDTVPGAVEYAVYRNTTNDFATAEFLASVTDTAYVDVDPYDAPGSSGCNHGSLVTFTYWVTSVDACGESAPSVPDEGFENPMKSASLVPDANQLGDVFLLAGLVTIMGFLRMRRTRKAC